MADKLSFDSVSYQRYVSDIRSLVTDFSKINQDILEQTKRYNSDNYQAYSEHLKAILETTNPMDYYRLNRSFFQESSSRFMKLLERRSKVFCELNNKLSQADNIMFLFPQPIQDAFHKYRECGIIESISPTVWNEFTQKFQNK